MSIGRGDYDNQPRRKQGDMEGGGGVSRRVVEAFPPPIACRDVGDGGWDLPWTRRWDGCILLVVLRRG
jgi:hypothetical protein